MAYRRFEILDVRLPADLKHDATFIKVLCKPNLEDSESLIEEKLLLYKDAERKNEIKEATGVDDDDIVEVDNRDKLRLYEFNLDFEKYDVYFITYDLYYNDVTHSGWARPLMITKDTDGYAHNDVEVLTPIVSVSTDPNNAELGGFTISTTPFRTFLGTALHKYTSWYIEDYTGNVVWKREKDDVNLTSIRIPANILNVNSIYTIKVIHFSNGLVPSNPGKLIIKTKGELSEVERIIYGNQRPVITGGKASMEELEEAYTELFNKYINTTIGYKSMLTLCEDEKEKVIEEKNEINNELNETKEELQEALDNYEALKNKLEETVNEYLEQCKIKDATIEEKEKLITEAENAFKEILEKYINNLLRVCD